MPAPTDDTPPLSPVGDARLLLVSNRLPITVKRAADGGAGFQMAKSSGGLVAGLSGLSKTHTFQWYGWPGLEVADAKERARLTAQLQADFDAVPVFVDRELADLHYNGFSNSILWPLFHYHPFSFDEEAWNAYNEVNRLFARAVVRDVRPGDMVWVHDYHLMLLPKMLREEMALRAEREGLPALADVRIGFFLHTPFPSSEVYRALPTRRPLLEGVLPADLVGFHTADYARHFRSACQAVLGLAHTAHGVVRPDGRRVRVGAFPIGIEPAKFHDRLQHPDVQRRIAELEQTYRGVKLIVGVDRLDYIKGLPRKLLAFESFLVRHPEWQGKVKLVQVAVPSRDTVGEYQNLQAALCQAVGRITGAFSTLDGAPLRWIHNSMAFDELLALYAVADACLVTSERDGMNLVAFEYVATQRQRKGVLCLSEFAGAAQSLHEGLVFNPYSNDEIVACIHEAVTMSEEQRAARFEALDSYVNDRTSAHWGQSFVNELIEVTDPVNKEFPTKLTRQDSLVAIDKYEPLAPATHRA